MMSYQRIGFFFELSVNEQRERLTALRRNEGDPNEAEIIQYLSSGIDAGVAMLIEHDALCDPPKPLGEATLKSDGEWIWPSSLAYYVYEYHIKLPQEFIEKMTACEWRVPEDAEYMPEIPEGQVEM